MQEVSLNYDHKSKMRVHEQGLKEYLHLDGSFIDLLQVSNGILDVWRINWLSSLFYFSISLNFIITW